MSIPSDGSGEHTDGEYPVRDNDLFSEQTDLRYLGERFETLDQFRKAHAIMLDSSIAIFETPRELEPWKIWHMAKTDVINQFSKCIDSINGSTYNNAERADAAFNLFLTEQKKRLDYYTGQPLVKSRKKNNNASNNALRQDIEIIYGKVGSNEAINEQLTKGFSDGLIVYFRDIMPPLPEEISTRSQPQQIPPEFNTTTERSDMRKLGKSVLRGFVVGLGAVGAVLAANYITKRTK